MLVQALTTTTAAAATNKLPINNDALPAAATVAEGDREGEGFISISQLVTHTRLTLSPHRPHRVTSVRICISSASLYLMRERKEYLSIYTCVSHKCLLFATVPTCSELCAILIVLDIIFARAALLDYIVGDPLDRSVYGDL